MIVNPISLIISLLDRLTTAFKRRKVRAHQNFGLAHIFLECFQLQMKHSSLHPLETHCYSAT